MTKTIECAHCGQENHTTLTVCEWCKQDLHFPRLVHIENAPGHITLEAVNMTPEEA